MFMILVRNKETDRVRAKEVDGEIYELVCSNGEIVKVGVHIGGEYDMWKIITELSTGMKVTEELSSYDTRRLLNRLKPDAIRTLANSGYEKEKAMIKKAKKVNGLDY